MSRLVVFVWALILSVAFFSTEVRSQAWVNSCPLRGDLGCNLCGTGRCLPPSPFFNCTLPSEVRAATRALFPEASTPDPTVLGNLAQIRLPITTATTVNFTFVDEVTGGTNSFGYFLWNETHGMYNRTVVFPCVKQVGSQYGNGCLRPGDTVMRGPFPPGQFLGFWIQQGGCSSTRGTYWYSFQSSVGTPNINIDGQNHTGWAYMSELGSIVMGFEDATNLGDRDYNDVMFTISSSSSLDLTDLPRYSGGILQNCRAGVIAQVDYVEYNCFQYALLSNPAGTTCSSFLSLPSGWRLMNVSDPELLSVIRDVGSTWDGSIAETGCLVVLEGVNPYTGYGYTVTGEPCDLNDNLDVKLLTPFSSSGNCFATPCGSRMLIKGQRVASCSGVSSTFCNPNSGNNLVNTLPSSRLPGQTVFPTAFNVYTTPSAPSISLPVSTFVPAPSAASLDTDLYLLLDTSINRGSNDINLISVNLFNFLNQITGSTFGFAPPNIGFGTIRYTGGVPSFFPHCALSVDATATRNCINTVSFTAASNTSQIRVLEGIDLAIAQLNRQSAWRSYAYKTVIVITDANPSSIGVDGLVRRMLDGNVVPTIYMPNPASNAVIANFRSVLNRLPLAGLLAGPTTPKTNRLDQWFQSSQVPTLLRNTILNITLARAYVQPDAVRDGFLLSLQSSISLAAASPSFGQVDRNISIAFPSGFDAANLPAVPFRIPVNVMGWGITGVNVFANRKPLVNNLALNTDENVAVNFDVPVSDPDNNLIRIMFLSRSDASSPVGALTTRAGAAVALNTWYNTTQFSFSPNQFWNGDLSFTYRASDGCENSVANAEVSINVRAVNQAPEADDFVVFVDENSAVNIDFTPYIRDIDDSRETLSITVLTVPSSTRGALWDTLQPNPTGVRLNTGNFQLGLRRRLNFVTVDYVSGNATFTYRVTDPGTLSSTARTVTVVVRNLRWPPQLTAPFLSLQAADGSTASVVVSIWDPDYLDTESVGLRITARGNTGVWGSHSVTTDSAGSPTLTGAAPTLPAVWSSLQLLPSNGDGTRAINITWTASGLRAATDPTFTIVAFDSDGRTSESITFTMIVTANRPPFAVLLPGTVAGVEDSPISSISLSGNDFDDSQWNNLSLVIVSAPSFGSLSFAANQSVLGTPLTQGVIYPFAVYSSGSFAAAAPNPRHSRFSVMYTPNTNFNGRDQFSYSFVDSLEATSAPDRVVVQIAPSNDAPQTSNITVFTNMETDVTISEFAAFDIDSGDILSLLVTSLPLDGTLTYRSAAVTADMLPLNLGTSPWSVMYTPPFEGYSDGAPFASFSFRVCDNSNATNNCSTDSWANVWVRFVNSPPRAQDVLARTTRNVATSFILPAVDRNLQRDPQEVLQARITSIGTGGDRSRNLGEFYKDSAMTQLVNVGDIIPFPRTLWFKPATDAFSFPAGTAVANLKFQAADHEPLYSDEATASVVIDFVNEPPQFVGPLTITVQEDVPQQIVLLQSDWIIDDLLDERLVRDGGAVFASIATLPARGTLSICFVAGNCTVADAATAVLPIAIPDEFGRVIFTPEPDTWGNNYASFIVNFTDSGKPFGPARWAQYTFTINVVAVNDAPVASAINFIPLGENDGNIMNEDSSIIFTWREHDKDSLPSTLVATIQFSKYSRAGWTAYDCFYDPDIPNAPCELGDPIGNSDTGFRNALVPEKVNSTTCTSLGAGYPFTDFSGCWAQFSIVFVPSPSVSSIPFIQLVFVAVDDFRAEGEPLPAILSVLPVNDPPTIVAPSLVAPAAGIKTMRIVDDLGLTVQVADPDVRIPARVEEKLIIEIFDFAATFLPSKPSACVEIAEAERWECIDTLKNINTWMNDSQIQILTEDGFSEARVRFTIDDLGNISPEGRPTPLNASAETRFVFTRLPEIGATPPPNNNLTIVVATVAAAALVLLALAFWALRRRFQAPTDGYFEVGVQVVATAPVNPLYKAQFTDKTNPLYK